MKVTLARNLGRVDLAELGLLTDATDAAAVAEATATYKEGATVDVTKAVHERLVKRGLVLEEVKGVAPAPAITGVSEESPVHQSNVADAVDTISRMTSKDKLQHVIDNDTRPTVKEAAKKRLASL